MLFFQTFCVTNVQNIIRIGSAGAMTDQLKLKDIVLGMSAYTNSGVITYTFTANADSYVGGIAGQCYGTVGKSDASSYTIINSGAVKARRSRRAAMAPRGAPSMHSSCRPRTTCRLPRKA